MSRVQVLQFGANVFVSGVCVGTAIHAAIFGREWEWYALASVPALLVAALNILAHGSREPREAAK